MPDAVLVTGATGFIGRHLVSTLAADGCTVHQHSRAHGDIVGGLDCPAPVGHVFHLAGKTFVPDSWTDTSSFYAVNVQGTIQTLEYCRRHRTGLTLLSSYVYGDPQRRPIDEDHPLVASNPYSHSKILSEHAARFYADRFGVRVTIVRPFNVYGPGQDPRFLIPSLLRQATDDSSTTFTVADSRPRRDYIHVRDLVDLIVALYRGVVSGTFNAGSGALVAIPELVATLNALLDGPARPLESLDQSRPQEIVDPVADTTRAQTAVGWRPKISLREGLAEMLSALRTEAAVNRR